MATRYRVVFVALVLVLISPQEFVKIVLGIAPGYLHPENMSTLFMVAELLQCLIFKYLYIKCSQGEQRIQTLKLLLLTTSNKKETLYFLQLQWSQQQKHPLSLCFKLWGLFPQPVTHKAIRIIVIFLAVSDRSLKNNIFTLDIFFQQDW